MELKATRLQPEGHVYTMLIALYAARAEVQISMYCF